MKRTASFVITISWLLSGITAAQDKKDYSGIDLMLAHSEFNRVADTCSAILVTDSSNALINYKMGFALQNLMAENKALQYFVKAYSLEPENSNYKFSAARLYYSMGMTSMARPLLESLIRRDSLNWPCASYLTNIYMQEGRYDESLIIYKRFYKQDSMNCMYMDKIAFALMKKNSFIDAICMYSQSLSINYRNTITLRNLAYLYSKILKLDTAVQLLTAGIEIDSTDIDLYVRRASLNFMLEENDAALSDYLRIISMGDSSVTNLKRTGICYFNNNKYEQSVRYLTLAADRDSADYATLLYLARNYHFLEDQKQSAIYYNKAIDYLKPFNSQLGINYIMLAEELKADGLFKEAIANYIKGNNIRNDPNVFMNIANIYDKNLNDNKNALLYYERFLKSRKEGANEFTAEYLDSVRERIKYLREREKIKS